MGKGLPVMPTRWPAMTAEMILAALVVVGFMASGSVFPILGALLSLVSPVPFVLLRLRHGFPALVFAILPAIKTRSLLRTRRRNRAGLCPRCGYDLRAHRGGDRCPECGAVKMSG